MNTKLHFSTGNDEHDTPSWLFEPIMESVNGFDLDPAASTHSRLADVNYTVEDDGLSHEWFGNVWCNPPYSQLTSKTWTERMACYPNWTNAVELVVGLLPNRTSTQWYHNSVSYADMVCHLEGRVSFVGSSNSAPFPSVIAVWGNYPDSLQTVLEDMGSVYTTVEK